MHVDGGLKSAVARRYIGDRIHFIQNLMEPQTMSEIIFVVEEAPEGGVIARAIGGAIVTEAESLAALREVVRDAVRCHFEEGQGPALIRLHYVHDEVIAA
jgi:hypothetical protein